MDQAQCNRLVAELLEEAKRQVSTIIEIVDSRDRPFCESPIEVLFASALWGLSAIRGRHIGIMRTPPYDLSHLSLGGCVAVMWPQAQIDDMRVDFLIVSDAAHTTTRCVVECDGHDFHERTKEQAERDRSRDRRLQGAGYRVFRFTGRELNRSAVTCAKEVLDWATGEESALAA
jgi:very-short-patch-repair endonuclease